MIKLNIANMEDFLQIVNKCKGAVNLLYPDGRKENINKRYDLQKELEERHNANKRFTPLMLDVPMAGDYLNIVFFAVGDC